MKTLMSAFLGLLFAGLCFAEDTSAVGAPKRTEDELEKLVAPIALYPDALVAIILPASTASADIVLAARFLAKGGKEADVEKQSWEESVKSLARYPALVKWMDENLEWTRALGEAFAAQPADVMNTVQRLRAKAKNAGLLEDTPQQRVVVRDEEIVIVPTRTEYVYIPTYDPEVLYVTEYHRPRSTWLTFSVGFAAGSWLHYDCDWRHRKIVKYRKPPGWTYRPDWRWRNDVPCDDWRPSHYWHRRHHDRSHHVYRPVPRVGPPRFNHDPYDRHHGGHRDGWRQPGHVGGGRRPDRGGHDNDHVDTSWEDSRRHAPNRGGSGHRGGGTGGYNRSRNPSHATAPGSAPVHGVAPVDGVAPIAPTPDLQPPPTTQRRVVNSRIPYYDPHQSAPPAVVNPRSHRNSHQSNHTTTSAPSERRSSPGAMAPVHVHRPRVEPRHEPARIEAPRHESPPARQVEAAPSNSDSGGSSSPPAFRSGRFGGGMVQEPR
jgi:hypothetical protein